jgi:hypothetical protein
MWEKILRGTRSIGKEERGWRDCSNAMEIEEETRANGISRSRHKMDKGK